MTPDPTHQHPASERCGDRRVYQSLRRRPRIFRIKR